MNTTNPGRSIHPFLGLVLGAFLLCGQAFAQPPQPVNFGKPVRSYAPVRVENRTFMVEKTLLESSPQIASQALARLNQNFNIALGLLPGHSRPALKRLKVFVMYGPLARGGGKNNGLEFFAKDAPQHFDTIDPRWSNCIVCYCAQNYTEISDLWALKAVLHELAHAYHLTHYAEDQADIAAAWKHALRAGLYLNLTDEDGKRLPKAYAATNPLEYFAELSVMYFGRCNYSPADREALHRYDPQGYALMRKMWRSSPEK